jgi:predicted TIM-barrel fold metal-dependent hydrolase
MPEQLTIDGDGHVMEPEDLWTARMDASKWGDWIPRTVTEDDCYQIQYVGGVVRAGGRELQDAMSSAVGMTPKEFYDLTLQLRVEGGHDPHARIADMDRDGIDVAVLYPSAGMFFGPVDPIPALHDVDFVLDCQRAYNDWLADYCSAYPTRLFGVAAAPLQDIDKAIGEVQRAVNEKGLRGVFIRPSAYIGELPLNHSVYDRFWAACQDLDIPVAFTSTRRARAASSSSSPRART